MKHHIILLLSLLTFKVYSQTCVIAKIDSSKQCIIIGSDTKFLMLTPKTMSSGFDSLYIYGPKIFHSGQITFATIGARTDYQKSIGMKTFEVGDNLNILVDNYINAYGIKILYYLDSLRQSSQELFDLLIRSRKKSFSQTIICGFYNKSPIIFFVNFTVNEQLNLTYKKIPTYAVIAGKNDSIGDLIYKPKTWKKGVKKGINYLLNIEANLNPIEVGKPFEFCEVYEDRVKWDRRNPFSHK